MPDSTTDRRIRIGMVGLGMIFDDTYRPLFEQLNGVGLWRRDLGVVEVELTTIASRTGRRVDQLRRSAGPRLPPFRSYHGPNAVPDMLRHPIDLVCVATPDDRHFEIAKAVLNAGKHVVIEKPSVLRLDELDELTALARANGVLAKIVYHKLFDPDHKKLRTHVADGALQHVNNGYCSLLEPKRISKQFSEWIGGRNPGTYVAVHYLKLVDFTFGPDWRLTSISATGQRGIIADAHGPTWDSVQLRIVYVHPEGREAAFDIHTSWVAPDRFPGSVEQEVQFRFDNGVWNAHQRKRGVELVVEDADPSQLAITPNHHYNADLLEPWGERRRRGYGLEAIRRIFEEVATVEFGGPAAERQDRLDQMRALTYNDLAADRNVVAAVQGMEVILGRHAAGTPGCIVTVNTPKPGLWLHVPDRAEPECLYDQII
jgi:D-galacturonate reductase